jgi:hypothetical protein
MSPLFPAKSGRWAANSLLGETGNSLSQIRENSGADQGSVQGFQRISCEWAFIGAKAQTAASQTPRNGACRRGSDVVVVRPGEIKGEQRGRMASTLAQRLNDQGVTAGPHQPVARVGFLVGGQAGLVDRRREFG